MSRQHRLIFESLERRNMLTGVTVEGGALTIAGSKLADNIQVEVSGNNLVVNMNGQQTTTPAWLVTGRAIVIDGLAGNDEITIAEGVTYTTTIHGGAGNDTIRGGDLDDLLFGNAGNDTIFGGEGKDTITGGAGVDTIHGDDGDDLINGDAGNDTIFGDAGKDECHGGAGNDIIHGGDGKDYLLGEAGKDVLYGDAGADDLTGDAGNDELHGGDGDDVLFGEDGNDSIYSDAGDDGARGGKGNDTIYGGDDEDWLRGDQGNDTIFGQLVSTFEVFFDRTPNLTVEVVVDGFVVGQVTCDNQGDGHLKYSSDPSSGADPFPVNFPMLHFDSTIEVGVDLRGRFGDASFI
jgi:Ca2+-binding RTX toxin-like protein